MAVHNVDIAALFNRMADLLEIEAANPFRIRAYRRAASTIEDLPEKVAQMVAEGGPLSDLPGIGEDLAGKIVEFVETGHLKVLDEVEVRTPSAQKRRRLRAQVNRLLSAKAIMQGTHCCQQGQVNPLSIVPAKPSHQIIDPVLGGLRFSAELVTNGHGYSSKAATSKSSAQFCTMMFTISRAGLEQDQVQTAQLANDRLKRDGFGGTRNR